MSLSRLPNELLEAIAREVPSERDLNSLVKASRLFYDALNRCLYRKNSQQRRFHNTALHWAATYGRLETILRAESLGVAIPATTLIVQASARGNMNVIKYLFHRVCREGAPPDLGKPSAVITAVEYYEYEALKFLVERGADLEVDGDLETALHVAVVSPTPVYAELLLDHGANLEALTVEGNTPLYLACAQDSVDVVELLLDRGANIGAVGEFGFTPIHLACTRKTVDVLELLLDSGADIGTLGMGGYTPLHTAIQGYSDVAELLLRRGADVNAIDNGGDTPLHLAFSAEDVYMLLHWGAEINARNHEGATPLAVAQDENDENPRAELASILILNGAEL